MLYSVLNWGGKTHLLALLFLILFRKFCDSLHQMIRSVCRGLVSLSSPNVRPYCLKIRQKDKNGFERIPSQKAATGACLCWWKSHHWVSVEGRWQTSQERIRSPSGWLSSQITLLWSSNSPRQPVLSFLACHQHCKNSQCRQSNSHPFLHFGFYTSFIPLFSKTPIIRMCFKD